MKITQHDKRLLFLLKRAPYLTGLRDSLFASAQCMDGCGWNMYPSIPSPHPPSLPLSAPYEKVSLSLTGHINFTPLPITRNTIGQLSQINILTRFPHSNGIAFHPSSELIYTKSDWIHNPQQLTYITLVD